MRRPCTRTFWRQPHVTDLFVTGGNPIVQTSTKSLAYLPAQYVTDPDADATLDLLRTLVRRDKHVALMCHFTHPKELYRSIVQVAMQRTRMTGAILRYEGPLVRHINDNPVTRQDMWKAQVRLGAVPYYMFVEWDTGPSQYFEVPLGRACDIFADAMANVSGVAKTVRGPSMSATPGKVHIIGVADLPRGQKAFVLQFLQARNPEWTQRAFFARFDPTAT